MIKARGLRYLQKIILSYILTTTVALMLVLVIFGAGPELSDGASYGDISVEQARTLMEANPSLIIVDVRTSEEYSLVRIERAVNLCVCDEEVLLLNLQPEDRILVYCLSGTRSRKAMMILNEHGYRYVYNMLGGISEWIRQGYPVAG